MKRVLQKSTLVLLLLFTKATFCQFEVQTMQFYFDSGLNPKVVTSQGNTEVKTFAPGINVNVGGEWFNTVLEVDFHSVKPTSSSSAFTQNLKFTELYLGARFFPMRPLIMLGKLTIRPILGAAYGFDLEPNYRGILFGGAAITGIRNFSGIVINFVRRPGTFNIGGYEMPPYNSIRIGIILGPSAKS